MSLDVCEDHQLEGVVNIDTSEDERQEYIAESFCSTERTKWKYCGTNCIRMEVDYVDRYMFGKAKSLVKPTLQRCEAIMKCSWETSNVDDFTSIYLHRNWYILIHDYINERCQGSEKAVEFWEILEMMKVWILQFFYGTTATHLFQEKEDWFSKTAAIKITRERYAFIVHKLGAGLPELDIYEGSVEEEESGIQIWGNFEQFNPILTKLEQHIGDIGQSFLFGNLDITIDDDKLRHSSSKFRDEGLQITGFRGSRIGPVMNAMGIVQNGLITSVHFSRHGDSSGTVVKSLFKTLRYGLEPTL